MGAAVNQRVTVSTAKMIQGAGKITVDGVELGSFMGGVTLTQTKTMIDVKSEQAVGKIDTEIKDVTWTVKTELEEATLENLALAWGMSTSSVLSGTSSKVLDLTMPATSRELALTFEGQSATDRTKTRVYSLSRVTSIGTTGVKQQRGQLTTVPVEFDVLQISGSQSVGTVTDNTITA